MGSSMGSSEMEAAVFNLLFFLTNKIGKERLGGKKCDGIELRFMIVSNDGRKDYSSFLKTTISLPVFLQKKASVG